MQPFRAFGGTCEHRKRAEVVLVLPNWTPKGSGIQPASLQICRNLAAVFRTSITVDLNKWRCQHPHLCLPKQTCEFGMRKRRAIHTSSFVFASSFFSAPQKTSRALPFPKGKTRDLMLARRRLKNVHSPPFNFAQAVSPWSARIVNSELYDQPRESIRKDKVTCASFCK